MRDRIVYLILLGLLTASLLSAQQPKVVWSEAEKPIVEQLGKLRQLPDDVRARTTRQLALQIRQLPASANKLRLATGLAGLSTEGDFGRDTLQEVTTTLAGTLRTQPAAGKIGRASCRERVYVLV